MSVIAQKLLWLLSGNLRNMASHQCYHASSNKTKSNFHFDICMLIKDYCAAIKGQRYSRL